MALIIDVPWLILTRSAVPDSPGTMRIAVTGIFGLVGVFLQLNCSSWENVLSQMFGILAILCSLAKRSVSYYYLFVYFRSRQLLMVIGLCSKTQYTNWPV